MACVQHTHSHTAVASAFMISAVGNRDVRWVAVGGGTQWLSGWGLRRKGPHLPQQNHWPPAADLDLACTIGRKRHLKRCPPPVP